MRLTLRASMILLLSVAAGSVRAQFLQYTPPGGPELPPESRQQEIERELEEARYHLGPVRIAPWFSLHDVAYVRNLFPGNQAPPDDYTATVGAGLRAYLRNGRKATWTLQALPEYVWWGQQSDRRRLNGRYLLGYYGYFNRLTLEARAGREQEQRLVTPEVPVPVSARSDRGELLVEIEISHALFAFTVLDFSWQKSLVDDLEDPRAEVLSLLDRDERVARAGLRWRPRKRWTIGLGAERSEVDFDPSLLDRSNEGTSPLAELEYAGRRVRFEAHVVDRSLTARHGAAFVPYDKPTGDVALFLGPQSPLTWTLYANRNLVYSLSPDYPYLDDDRLGLAVTSSLGRLLTRLFVETGRDGYTAYAASTPRRQDDVLSYGATVTFRVVRNVSVGLQALRSEFDSNLPGADRSYTTVGTTVNLVGGR